MRTLFITDIHGHFEEMLALFRCAEFSSGKDKLFVGGDMINRGPESAKVVKFIKKLQDANPESVKAVRGNHEDMVESYLWGRSKMWLDHGGYETIASFNAAFPDEKEKQAHLDWICELPLVAEDEKFVFAHAGIDPYCGLYFQDKEIVWMDSFELYGYEESDLLLATRGKILVHGHTPTESPMCIESRLGCDLGAGVLPVSDAGLGLVDLTNRLCHRISLLDGAISTSEIWGLKKGA